MEAENTRLLKKKGLKSYPPRGFAIFLLSFVVVFTAGISCGPDKKKKTKGPPKAATPETGSGGAGGSEGQDEGKGKGKGDGKSSSKKGDDDDDDDVSGSGSKGSSSSKNPKGPSGGSNSSATGGTNSGLLKATDFPAVKTPITKQRFMQVFASIGSATKHFDSVNLEETSGSGDCTAKVAAIKGKATEKNLSFELAGAQCTANPGNRPVSIRGFARYTCAKNAFAKLDGQRYDSLKNSPIAPLCESSKLTFVRNFSQQVQASTGSSTGSSGGNFSKSITAYAKADGSPCDVEVGASSFTFGPGCNFFHNLETRLASGSVEKISFRGQYRGAKAEFGDPLFSAGTLEFTMNDWTGTVRFTPAGRQYTATSSTGEKASGSIL